MDHFHFHVQQVQWSFSRVMQKIFDPCIMYILCLHSCRWFIQKLHSVLQTNCQCLVDVRGSSHHRGRLKGTRLFKHSLGNIIFQVHLMCCRFFLWYYDKFDKHKNRPNEDVIVVVSFFCKQIQEKTTSHKIKVQLIELVPDRWKN